MVSTFQLLAGTQLQLVDSLKYTAIGVLVVFAVLVILIVLIESLHVMLKDKQTPVQKTQQKANPVEEKRISAGVMAEAPEADKAQDDGDFIAAVSAAITCATGNSNFKIKSIKKG